MLAHNNRKIITAGNPIILIESENMGKALSMSDKNFNHLISSMFLCVGANVALTKNYLNAGLSNSSIGIVKELFHNLNKLPSALPKFIFVNFDAECTGE